MTDSPTLGLDLQATGSNSGTWGTVTNANLSILDNRNGGSLAVNVAGSSNVTLTESNVENVFLRLTGVLTGNIDLIFPATRGGTYLIQNDSTGSFSITAKPSGGTGVTVPQGAMTVVFVNLTLSAAYKVAVIDPASTNIFTALQTFTAGVAINTTGLGTILTLQSTEASSAAAPYLSLFRDSPSPANSDVMGTLLFEGNDSGGTRTVFGRIQADIGTVTDGAEAGRLYFGVVTGGALANKMRMDGTSLIPFSNDLLALGNGLAGWSDLFLASGGVLNWNNSTYTVTQSSTTLAFSGGITLGTALPVASGGTGAATLTGLLQGNGTGAITGGATINNSNWSGTDLSVANGGTGASTLTGILIGNGTSAVTGTGSSTLGVANGGTGAATLTGLLQGNGTSAITGGATINNDNWSGTDLSVANGGTGASTLTGLLQGNGTGAITGGATINNSNWSGTDLSVANGGTGASTLTGLLQGNGTGAITGGATINNGDWSGTDLAIANGGTGQSTAAAGARALLDGLGTTKGNILWYNSQWEVLGPPSGSDGEYYLTITKVGGVITGIAWVLP